MREVDVRVDAVRTAGLSQCVHIRTRQSSALGVNEQPCPPSDGKRADFILDPVVSNYTDDHFMSHGR
jgi:hypothetical protein